MHVFITVKYHLDGQSPETLNYLLQGDTTQDIAQDKSRFNTWRVSYK